MTNFLKTGSKGKEPLTVNPMFQTRFKRDGGKGGGGGAGGGRREKEGGVAAGVVGVVVKTRPAKETCFS